VSRAAANTYEKTRAASEHSASGGLLQLAGLGWRHNKEGYTSGSVSAPG